jgi:hypothetical protein
MNNTLYQCDTEQFEGRYSFNSAGLVVDKVTGETPTAEELSECDRLHAALMQADGEFQTELVKRYGRNAGDMRYRSDLHTPKLKTLADRYVKACNAWRDTFRAANARP